MSLAGIVMMIGIAVPSPVRVPVPPEKQERPHLPPPRDSDAQESHAQDSHLQESQGVPADREILGAGTVRATPCRFDDPSDRWRLTGPEIETPRQALLGSSLFVALPRFEELTEILQWSVQLGSQILGESVRSNLYQPGMIGLLHIPVVRGFSVEGQTLVVTTLDSKFRSSTYCVLGFNLTGGGIGVDLGNTATRSEVSDVVDSLVLRESEVSVGGAKVAGAEGGGGCSLSSSKRTDSASKIGTSWLGLTILGFLTFLSAWLFRRPQLGSRAKIKTIEPRAS